MKKIIPPRLQKGDTIRVIAPSQSLASLPEEKVIRGIDTLASLGFRVTLSKYSREINEFGSSTIQQRVDDLNDAFSDKTVKAIITARGGYNSNELLPTINWEIIQKNPKIFIGYSDITILSNAIFSQTGLVTYLGPTLATFGQKKDYPYTLNYFLSALTSNESYKITPSKAADYTVPSKGEQYESYISNKNYRVINPGIAEGALLGGNLCSFNLLQGTKYFPNVSKTILFLEEDDLAGKNTLKEFDRNLESLLQQSSFETIKAIILGRFQRRSNISLQQLTSYVNYKQRLKNIPIIAAVDFGHTNPMVTVPIGGYVKIKAYENVVIEIFNS